MDWNDEKTYRPSGVVLPRVLREKLRQERVDIQKNEALLASARSLPEEDRMRIMTARQIEEELWNTSGAIVEVQKQIQRGEESYYEETQVAHGSNLFRGWEGFIDARDVGNANASHLPVGGNSRRMPGDFRWFSSTCNNISRHMKPFSMGTRITASVGTTIPKASSFKAAASSTKVDRKRALDDNTKEKVDDKTPKGGGKTLTEGRESKRAKTGENESSKKTDGKGSEIAKKETKTEGVAQRRPKRKRKPA